MNNFETARIIKENRGCYIVLLEGREYPARLSGRLMNQKCYPVVGDYVSVRAEGADTVVIHEIRERFSYLSRPDSGGHADGFIKTYLNQPMAANLDYLFIITALNGDFSTNRVARFAAASIRGGCKPVAILTKADLCPERERFAEQLRSINPSIEVLCVSAVTGEGMDRVREYLKPGVTIGLMGSSGVGKSTLVNTLAGRERMKVGEIREEDSKGRHTTTCREMLNIDGTWLLDTPGMRGFGLCDAEEGIREAFEDIAALTEQCRFRNCHHRTEPGCAVKQALENNELTAERWELYRSLMAESRRCGSMAAKRRTAARKTGMN